MNKRLTLLLNISQVLLASAVFSATSEKIEVRSGKNNQGAFQEYAYQAISNLEEKLSIPWTRQGYIDACLNSQLFSELKNNLEKARQRKKALGRFHFWPTYTMAALYCETGRAELLELVRDSLLHEASYPSGDLQFALGPIAGSYALIRDQLSEADRHTIEEGLARDADESVKLESGSEMNRGITNLLGLLRVCKLLPDHPHRSVWEKTWKYNWEQGLLRMKDNNEDAIGYNHLWMYAMMMAVDEMGVDQKAFYEQPWIKEIFERHLNVRTPLGVEPETIYSALQHEPDQALEVMEWAGKIYQDGRYRWAAQRIMNFYRSQRANGNKTSRNPVFLYTDDHVVPVEPDGKNYYSHRRYDREFPNKLALRSGYGPDASFLALNLFNVGGHGLADGSAIYCLMDQYALLLSGGHRYSPEEQYSNLLMIRPQGVDFPFGDPLRPDIWRRIHINLRSGNTAAGGLNINLHEINQIGLRIESEGSGKITLGKTVATGPKGSKTLFNGEKSMDGRWPSVPLNGTVDLEDYDGIDLFWKYDKGLELKDVQVVVNSDNPKATSRWAKGIDNWRDSHVRFFGDAAKAHFASVEVDVYSPDGSNHRQVRDIIMLPNRLFWIRDTMIWGGGEACQAGPLWHVRNLNGQGSNWFQTATCSIYDQRQDDSWTEAGSPRSLLIVLPEHKNRHSEQVVSEYCPGGRPYTVFQKWEGKPGAGQQTAFNSLLIPNDGKEDPSGLSAQAQLLFEDDHAAVLHFGNWLLVDNPDGKTVEAAGLKTDFRLLAVELDSSGKALWAAGMEGTQTFFNGHQIEIDRTGN